MVRAEAIAATSTTRRKRDARSLSMFSPKMRALPSGRVCVAIGYPPCAPFDAVDTRRVETIAQSRAGLKDILDRNGPGPHSALQDRSCKQGPGWQALKRILSLLHHESAKSWRFLMSPDC